MERIPEKRIEQIKQKANIVNEVRGRGIALKPQGSELCGLCPFHSEKTPSFFVNPEKQVFKCQGCGVGGDVIKFIQKMEGKGFLEVLSDLNGSPVTNKVLQEPKKEHYSEPPPSSSSQKQEAVVNSSMEDEVLMQQVMAHYHQALFQSPEALQYLKKRKIEREETIKTFQLGYANRTLGLTLPGRKLKEGSRIRERLQALGIFRKSGHEHLAGSLVVPIIDEAGRVTQMYGRKTHDDLKEGTLYHLYLARPHTTLFNPQALRFEEIILGECLLDALSFIDCGFLNVTCAYGINNFKKLVHLKAFLAQGIKSVKIAYDNDEPGNRAAEELVRNLLIPAGIACQRVEFPQEMDANQFACRFSSWEERREQLDYLLKSARPMGRSAGTGLQGVEIPSGAPSEEPADRSGEERQLKIKGEEVSLELGERIWRVRGLFKNQSFEVMRVNLRLSVERRYHIDTLDLYNAKARMVFINAASEEVSLKADLIKHDLGRLLLQLEERQSEHFSQQNQDKEKKVLLSEKEREEAIAYLKQPDLLHRLLKDFELSGIVGEEINKLVGYLAATSRKFEKPLAIIIQSTSAAGKSALMEAILSFIPEEERVQYSAMTGQSLFYMGEKNLAYKILAIVEEEGAEKATYALKLLSSEGQLSIASTGKDPHSGRLVTHEYIVEGPVMIFSTTTAIDLDEEYLNRCLILTVDEGREQTEAIHQRQRFRYSLEGWRTAQKNEELRKLHQNVQRVLRPLPVINPYYEQLTFPTTKTRTRRDHPKYLTLIHCITLLHQYQRPLQKDEQSGREYLEVSLEDIEMANELAHEVLGRTLDELPPQSRKLLGWIERMTEEDCQARQLERGDYRFTRRRLRDYSGWGNTQLKVHLYRLVDLEYLLVHPNGGGRYAYELLYHGEAQKRERFCLGLMDVSQLKASSSSSTMESGRGQT